MNDIETLREALDAFVRYAIIHGSEVTIDDARAALSRIEARIEELEAALQEAVNTLGPDHFAGDLVGLIAEGNEALRVLRAALEGKDREEEQR